MNDIAQFIINIRKSKTYQNKIKILDLQNKNGKYIFSNIKNLNLYYVFEINEQSGSGYAKAILISDEQKINIKGTKSTTGHCFTGNEPFRIKIKNKKYCINPNSKTIIKIKQSGFKIGDIIYKKNNNANEFIRFEEYNNLKTNNIINRSFIHLYNYEVQYMQLKENNMLITSKGYKPKITNIYYQKSFMYPILDNNTSNNNYIRTIHNYKNNIKNKYNKSKKYRNNIIRKKVFFSKEIIKVVNPYKINNNENNNGLTNSEINIVKIPKILTNLTCYDKDIIKILYDIYLNYASRTKMTEINKNKNFKNYYQKLNNNFDSLLIENREILKTYFDNKKIIDNIDCYEDKTKKTKNDLPIIYNIKTNKNVIIIGDIHGSFHSFFRIFLRLLKQKIINNDLTLNNYKLIFLGDVFDRGEFAYECLILIFILMKVNNSENELNVILNRGNHEDYNIAKFYGFHKELIQKYYNNQNVYVNKKIYNELFNFIETYLSWAIILTHNDTKYWLCHGGFPFDKDLVPIDFNKYYEYDIFKLKHPNSHISWNDFHNQSKTIINTPRRAEGKYMLIIGTNDLKKFLYMNKIDFIIRGHQDNNCNDHLLMKYYKDLNNSILPLTFLISYQLIKDYQKLIACKYNTPPEESNKELKKSNGSFMTINPKSKKFKEENKDLTIYPVLTISTNSDLDRILFHDSFVVLKSKRNETS